MNSKNEQNQDSYRELLLMTELEDGAPISQREIAGRLGVALGLVNTYLKKLVSKGYVTVKTFPRNRYAYLLTPQGLAEKSRLAFQQVGFFHKIFRIVREDSSRLFVSLKEQGVNEVVFCGVDEFTEIAYLSLCEAGLSLKGIADDHAYGGEFLGRNISNLSVLNLNEDDHYVITSFRCVAEFKQMLTGVGVPAERVHVMAVPLLEPDNES